MPNSKKAAPTLIQWRLAEIAAPQRWTQRSLAKAAGLAYGTVHAMWNNETTRADLNTIAALARVLGVQPGDLMAQVEIDEAP